MPLPLILPPLTPPPLTPPPMTLPLLSRRRSNRKAAEMLVDKWDDAGANSDVNGWIHIFVCLICRSRK